MTVFPSALEPYLAYRLGYNSNRRRVLSDILSLEMKLLDEAHDCRVSSHWLPSLAPKPQKLGIFAISNDKVRDRHVPFSSLEQVLIVVGEEVHVDSLVELQGKCK